MEKVTLAFVLLAFACSVALVQSSTPVQTFYVNSTADMSKVCLHMEVAISVTITYNSSVPDNNTNTNTMHLNLTGEASMLDDSSRCDPSKLDAELFISPDGDEFMQPVYMVFSFNGQKDHWSMGAITLYVDSELLGNYTGPEGNYSFNTTDKLHQDPNADIEFTRSYICSHNQDLVYQAHAGIYPSVTVSNLRVQAFKFEDPNTGKFDNARTCLLDTAGKANKIVPIAVGAALAGLVVVVLVAYLIGRLRSRRQSSYEALS